MKTAIVAIAVSLAGCTWANATSMPSDLRGLYCSVDDVSRDTFVPAEDSCGTLSIEFKRHGFVFHDDDVPVKCNLISAKVIGRDQVYMGSARNPENWTNVYRLRVKCDQGEPAYNITFHIGRGGIVRWSSK